MNSFEVQNYKIELVFENCESIDVSIGAIVSFYMTTRGKRMVFDTHTKQMSESQIVDTLEMTLTLSDASNFYHSSQNQMLSLGTESVITDRHNCVDRIKTSTDITHIYINGVCYQMPWNEELRYSNKFQTNSNYKIGNKEFVRINIKSDKAINDV